MPYPYGLLNQDEEVSTLPLESRNIAGQPPAPMGLDPEQVRQEQARLAATQLQPPESKDRTGVMGLLSDVGGYAAKGIGGLIGLPFAAARGASGLLMTGEQGGTANERRIARNAAMRRAGLHMIMASRSRTEAGPPDPFRSIAGGVLAGQERFGESLTGQKKAAWEKTVDQITQGEGFEGLTIAQLDKLITQAMRYNPEMVPYLAEIRKTMQTKDTDKWLNVGDRMIKVDSSGNVVAEHGINAELDKPTAVYNPDTGQVEMAVWNPAKGGEEGFYDYTGTPAPRSDRMTEKQSAASAFLVFAGPKLDWLDEQVAPGELNQFKLRQMVEGGAAGAAAWQTVPVEEQKLFSGAVRFAEAWLRITTGAAYNPTEYYNALLQFVPLAGDQPGMVEEKKENRRGLMRMLYIISKGKPLTFEDIKKYTGGALDFLENPEERFQNTGAGGEEWGGVGDVGDPDYRPSYIKPTTTPTPLVTKIFGEGR